MKRSRGPDHFRNLYEFSPDPWDLAGSAYEAAKYEHTLDMLGDRHFAAGLEVGCSVGVLTKRLARRCDALLAVDIVEEPLRLARARCADLTHVQFVRMQAPQDWPNQTFDLVVLSEILYFLSLVDIKYCARRVVDSTTSNAALLLVNWLGRTDDPSTGDEAADGFIAAVDGLFRVDRAERTNRYRIDELVRVLPASIPVDRSATAGPVRTSKISQDSSPAPLAVSFTARGG
jgi:SAM-dependent methyltransferase